MEGKMNVAETVATEPKPKGARMERFNMVLPVDDSEWLDRFTWEIREHNVAKVSRSETVRAAIAGLPRIASPGIGATLKICPAREGAHQVRPENARDPGGAAGDRLRYP
jgi:hypothetical protein